MSNYKADVPPRSSADILAFMAEAKPNPEETRKLEETLNSKPPRNGNPEEIGMFYYQRGLAARKLGLFAKGHTDLTKAFEIVKKHPTHFPEKEMNTLLLEYMQDIGQFSDLKEILEFFKFTKKQMPNRMGFSQSSVDIYLKYGFFDEANKEITRFEEVTAKWGPIKWKKSHEYFVRAITLKAEGRYREAEPYIKRMIAIMDDRMIAQAPTALPYYHKLLAENLLLQGKAVEAEYNIRKSLEMLRELFGTTYMANHSRILVLVDTISAQNRTDDAQQLLNKYMENIQALQRSPDSFLVMEARSELGKLLILERQWKDALALLRKVEKVCLNESLYANKYLLKSFNLSIALIMSGHSDQALKYLDKTHSAYTTDFGNDHRLTREALGLKGAAYLGVGKKAEALKAFMGSVPWLLENNPERSIQFNIIMESYLELLNQLQEAGLDNQLNVDPVHEAFRISDALMSRSVQDAFTKNLSRAALKDPQLAEIARQEQDSQLQIEAFEGMLSRHLAAPPAQRVPKVIADLRGRIKKLQEAQRVLQQQVKEQFPSYSRLMNPIPVTPEQVRNLLKPDQVLIAVYSADKQSYIWAVPKTGPVKVAVSPWGRNILRESANRVRWALDPAPETVGDIPHFNLKLAHNLYTQLLKPVEDSWQEAKELLIVASGPLGPLPFSVLPTAQVSPTRGQRTLFSEYRDVPWLIRKVALIRLPSASSYVSLGQVSSSVKGRKAFVGFGDPYFSPKQLADAKANKSLEPVHLYSRGVRLQVRSVRGIKEVSIDDESLTSLQMEQLKRLPDTGEEIKSIASALGANQAQDVFLGVDASEKRIKTMNLSNQRVVVFATHALLPGDLDGLDQPALAFSSPTVTGDNEDGLLTMSEIFRLKLNSDWVVLSACNTGAGGGAGAEAVSGLGRAFIYAGSRAILVSMWPVETSSARKLTTGIFHYQSEDRTLPRAKALQKSILELIDNQVFKDETTGKIVASYAHPFFWAPFIIVGDGG